MPPGPPIGARCGLRRGRPTHDAHLPNHRHDGRGRDPHDHRGQLVLEPCGRLHLRRRHRSARGRSHRPARALLEALWQRGSEKADARGGRSSRNAHGVNVSTQAILRRGSDRDHPEMQMASRASEMDPTFGRGRFRASGGLLPSTTYYLLLLLTTSYYLSLPPTTL